MLVDGVTKSTRSRTATRRRRAVRKMVVAMARDIRVLVIKLADRLHNARTWKYVSSSSAGRKARETLEIYAPLAHRLGMNTIKWELENLSFQALYPKVYDEIVHLVAERAPAREEYLAVVREQVTADLRSAKIKATVTGRPSTLLDLPEDDRARPRLRGDLRPRRRARPGGQRPGLLCGARRAARAVEPRAGAVQGLHRDAEVQHVPVVAHDGHRAGRQAGRDPDPHARDAPTRGVRRRGALEVQGDREVGGKTAKDDAAANDMRWLRQLVDWQRETADPAEFLDSLRFEIGGAEVYVFTPKGDVMALPAGRRRSTSPTRCTPRSGTGRWARASTGGSSRSTRRSERRLGRRPHLEVRERGSEP